MDPTTIAVLGLVFAPFGDLSGKLASHEPWHGFHSEDPVLTVVRAQEVADPGLDCDRWAKVASNFPAGAPLNVTGNVAEQLVRDWEPWEKQELEAASDCDDFPCKEKLDQRETDVMKATPEKARRDKFLDLVAARVADYRKTGAKRASEYPGTPIDPWERLTKLGFRSEVPRPPTPEFFARRIDFAEGRLQVLRQVFDRRFASKKDPKTGSLDATVWMRDVYTNHYFDSWGEWIHLVCEPKAKSVLISQVVMLELDALKDTDLLSHLGRSKMRAAAQEYGDRYLDREFELIRSGATTLKNLGKIPSGNTQKVKY